MGPYCLCVRCYYYRRTIKMNNYSVDQHRLQWVKTLCEEHATTSINCWAMRVLHIAHTANQQRKTSVQWICQWNIHCILSGSEQIRIAQIVQGHGRMKRVITRNSLTEAFQCILDIYTEIAWMYTYRDNASIKPQLCLYVSMTSVRMPGKMCYSQFHKMFVYLSICMYIRVILCSCQVIIHLTFFFLFRSLFFTVYIETNKVRSLKTIVPVITFYLWGHQREKIQTKIKMPY